MPPINYRIVESDSLITTSGNCSFLFLESVSPYSQFIASDVNEKENYSAIHTLHPFPQHKRQKCHAANQTGQASNVQKLIGHRKRKYGKCQTCPMLFFFPSEALCSTTSISAQKTRWNHAKADILKRVDIYVQSPILDDTCSKSFAR